MAIHGGIDNLAQPQEGTRRAHADNGLQAKQQWQLALERAYLEKRSDQMSETKQDNRADVGPGTDHAMARPDNKGLQSAEPGGDYMDSGKTVPVRQGSAGMNPTGDGLTQTAAVASRNKATMPAVVSLAAEKMLSSRAPLRTDRAQPTPVTPPMVEGEMPGREAVRLVNAGDGLHLLIRGNDLDAETLGRIGSDVRRVLTQRGQSLVRIVLNGEDVWRANPETRPDNHRPSNPDDHRINKTY